MSRLPFARFISIIFINSVKKKNTLDIFAEFRRMLFKIEGRLRKIFNNNLNLEEIYLLSKI
jgi:hypothetical protein